MKNSFKTILLSLVVMALWGSLFPMVKIGYKVFDIAAGSVLDILMFAGMRFVVSGIIVCMFCNFCKCEMQRLFLKNVCGILLVGLFSIVLHYTFTYVGLSTTDSSKTALIKQLGALLYVCFSFLFFKSEKFSILKIIGAIIGFLGIVAINYSPGGIKFSVGDILIIGAYVCTVVSNVISKKSVEGNSPYLITGISQFSGGIVLLVAALVMGAKFPTFTLLGTAVFTYICAASIAGYTLWYYVLKSSSLSKLFIFKFIEPVFACVFGALLLGEDIFKIQYLLAFVLISIGILLGNKGDSVHNKLKSRA